MERRTFLGLALLLVSVSVAERAEALWPFGGTTQKSYTLHGFVDRAPQGTPALDQIDLTTTDGRKRTLVITRYTSPGDVPPFDGKISRDPVRHFTLRGPADDVTRLMSAPVDAPVEGSFVVSEGSPAALTITQLVQPRAATAAARD